MQPSLLPLRVKDSFCEATILPKTGAETMNQLPTIGNTFNLIVSIFVKHCHRTLSTDQKYKKSGAMPLSFLHRWRSDENSQRFRFEAHFLSTPISLSVQYTSALLLLGNVLLDVSKILHSTGSIHNVMLRQSRSPLGFCFVPTFNGLRLVT